jgi:T3SS (YopN, CesT) and YbjN peptide-binding chaperone 1
MATAEQTMMKVQRILTGPLGLKIMLNGDVISIRFNDISTSVQVRVVDWSKDDDGSPRSLVLITSLILKDLKPTPALCEWVARQGGSKWFGHVEMHDDTDRPGTVYLLMSHTLLGDYLDEKELSTAMWAVLGSADNWDDELQKQFGGKRWNQN